MVLRSGLGGPRRGLLRTAPDHRPSLPRPRPDLPADVPGDAARTSCRLSGSTPLTPGPPLPLWRLNRPRACKALAKECFSEAGAKDGDGAVDMGCPASGAGRSEASEPLGSTRSGPSMVLGRQGAPERTALPFFIPESHSGQIGRAPRRERV